MTQNTADSSWQTADQIASKLGFEKNSFVRLRSGIMYILSELSSDGHVYDEKKQFIKVASELLEAEGNKELARKYEDLQKQIYTSSRKLGETIEKL